jgi:ankyrin repeat protein
MTAASINHVAYAKELIAAGANVNAKAHAFGNWTALHAACRQGHLEIAQMLIEAGANIHAKSTLDDASLYESTV